MPKDESPEHSGPQAPPIQAQSEERIRQLQLEKLEREIAKLKAEFVDLSRSPWSKPANVVPMLIGILGVTGAWVQYVHSTEKFAMATERFEAVKQKHEEELEKRADKLAAAQRNLAEAERKFADKQKELVSVQNDLEGRKQDYDQMVRLTSLKQIELQDAQERFAKLQAEINDVASAGGATSQGNARLAGLAADAGRAATQAGQQASRPLVYIQFRGTLQRTLMRQLQEQLQAENYQAPGVERVAGSYGNSVRYFFSEDSDTADKVSAIVNRFFVLKGCPLSPPGSPQLVDPRSLSATPARGQIEIWIHHSCGA